MEENRRETEQKFAQIKCHGTLSKLQDTGFPFSAGRPPTKQEILDLLPAREVVDDLVDTYFKHFDPMFRIAPTISTTSLSLLRFTFVIFLT
jgi:hypothetical protein